MRLTKPLAILFDFDGTLIDSSQGILNSFQRILVSRGIEPTIPIDHHLIGPPLAQTLMRLTGLRDQEQITTMTIAFKSIYDNEGYQITQPYPALAKTLEHLLKSGQQLFIVTNKRRKPTLQIISLLNLGKYFAGIYTLDSQHPPATNKADLVDHLLAEQRLTNQDCILVGDSGEDAAAAAAHGIPFIAAAYGYGDAARQTTYPIVAQLDVLADLPRLLHC